MRKIDKTCALSTVYKKWEEALEIANAPHPKYNSSKGEYYWDIVMQLFYCQKGLCAYTEQELCADELFDIDEWQEGRYPGRPLYEGRFGQLEHFDESLKSKKSEDTGKKDWLWDNLFMVDSDINNRKGTKPVDDILKPDREGYNPFKLLEYDSETHCFIPNQGLDEITQGRIENMIDVLGVNHVFSTRRKYLKKHFQLGWYERPAIRDVIPEQYLTAIEMCIQLFEKEKVSLEALCT